MGEFYDLHVVPRLERLSSFAGDDSFVMKKAAQDAFIPFVLQFEGRTTWMYSDVKYLVTTGMGNLIDPIGRALALPWRHKDGSIASQAEITAEWQAVKNNHALADRRNGALFESVTNLRISNDTVDRLIMQRLRENDAYLARRFPSYAEWPAEAQLAANSLAWAMGPGFAMPKLVKALNATKFLDAAQECYYHGAEPERHAHNQKLFHIADAVVTSGADRTAFYYPNGVPAPGASMGVEFGYESIADLKKLVANKTAAYKALDAEITTLGPKWSAANKSEYDALVSDWTALKNAFISARTHAQDSINATAVLPDALNFNDYSDQFDGIIHVDQPVAGTTTHGDLQDINNRVVAFKGSPVQVNLPFPTQVDTGSTILAATKNVPGVKVLEALDKPTEEGKADAVSLLTKGAVLGAVGGLGAYLLIKHL